MTKHKILCSASTSTSAIEAFTGDINKEMVNYDSIQMVGTDNIICVLMYKKPKTYM